MLTGESQRKNPQTAFQLNVPGFEEYPFFYNGAAIAAGVHGRLDLGAPRTTPHLYQRVATLGSRLLRLPFTKR